MDKQTILGINLGIVLLITLPLFYLLFSQILLPRFWIEETETNSDSPPAIAQPLDSSDTPVSSSNAIAEIKQPAQP